jgi:hypothetical protein
VKPDHSLSLTIQSVLELAHLQGYTDMPQEVAQRVAVGASNAVRAVAAQMTDNLFYGEPIQFLDVLESLARDE